MEITANTFCCFKLRYGLPVSTQQQVCLKWKSHKSKAHLIIVSLTAAQQCPKEGERGKHGPFVHIKALL